MAKGRDYEPYKDRDAKRVIEEREKKRGPQGLRGTELSEDQNTFDLLSCERAIKGPNDAWIVLGRDRPSDKKSGGVGKGSTRSGMIDLVVGRRAGHGKSRGGREILAQNDFFSDAARVYISQKSDIDTYFGISKGSEEKSSKNRSAVAIKADHVRLIGRNHIKIVTGRAQASGAGRFGEKNSQGGNNEKAGRIDFIAGNHANPDRDVKVLGWFAALDSKEKMKVLQPLVKGKNLVDQQLDLLELLSDMVEQINWTNGQLSKLNKLVASHFHPIGAIGPVPIATPSPVLSAVCPVLDVVSNFGNKFKAKANNYNMGQIELNYLTEGAASKYINSGHVHTT